MDRLANLTRSQTKHVTVWKDNHQENFRFTGSSSELLERLTDMQADDFLVEEPPLEDLFLQYYEEAAK